MSPSRLARRTVVSVSAITALLLSAAYLTWRSTVADRRAIAAVENTHSVLDDIAALRAAVSASQGSLNAFLVTLDTTALRTFRENEVFAHVKAARLRSRTAENPGPYAFGDDIELGLLALDSARHTILNARRADLTAAREAFVTTAVARHRGEVLSQLDAAERAERELLRTRTAIEERARTSGLRAFILALLTAAGVVWWAVAATRHEMRVLHALSARHRALSDLNPDALLVQVDERIVYANTAAADLLGVSDATDLLGHKFCAFIHPEERAAARERLRLGRVENRSLEPARRRLLRPSGELIRAEVRVSQITYDGERASEIVIRDLTARLAVEDAYAESEARFRALLDAMAEGVVMQDANLKILLWNPAAESILGLTGSQLGGRTSYDPEWGVIDEGGRCFLAMRIPPARPFAPVLPSRACWG